MELPHLINNINIRVVDDLKNRLSAKSKVSIAAASFSIYAFEALKKELEEVEELRFIFTSPTFIKDKTKRDKREFYIPKLDRERNLYGTEFEIKLRNQLSQKAIARECATWIRKKVQFKSNTSSEQMGGFLQVEGHESRSYAPFNEFTTTELGLDRGNSVYSMVQSSPSPFADEYLKIFNAQWKDNEKFTDVTEEVLEYIETVYKENSPDYIYFITLYNIFNEFLEDLSEDLLPNEATGFKNSQIWNKLYNFQKDAALAIINKLEKYNGCILADSVGLGKTFTALSVIKYYENRNKSVLVLCPKKLNDNWITFRSNYKNNPIGADRLRYDILFHSDLSRESGKSNGLDLSHINWGNYDLIVIDESHNFRNGGKISTDEEDLNPKENRYLRLLNQVIRAGVKTKVLMLSATPVNNGFKDLKNQLQLAYEGESEKIDSLLETKNSMDDIFRQAQTAYNKWAKLAHEERSTAKLLAMLHFDFFEVLDSVTIARSRKHIERYYDTTDIGKFPTRLKPISRRPCLTDLSAAINYKEIYALLQTLNLAIYTPSDFILPSRMTRYIDFDKRGNQSGLSMQGREKGIRQLMAINMLKRLESSVNSFRLTIQRIEQLIEGTLRKIHKFSNNRSATASFEVDEYDLQKVAEDEEFYGAATIGSKKTKIEIADMDYKSWIHYLNQDVETLNLLLVMLKDITPRHDSKLQQLIEDLDQKFTAPINRNNKKVLIFTAFSDTAEYLYAELAGYIHEMYGLHTAMVTGSVDGMCSIKKLKADFNTVLTLFSPLSKERDVLFPDSTAEIDVLIATDCISEGQNLQDCDYVINYDIHWNPVRIIQRFGRVDRIGSKNEVIQLVNYWPDVELDDYIKLKGRVEARMKATILTATGDDNLLSDEEKGDLEYRKEQLKRLQEEVVDIEDMDTGINIMDLGLNEFRLDLLAYLKENPDITHTPFGMSAVVGSSGFVQPGVIYVLKNRNKGVNINNQNLLHPFYMVYIGHDGEVICDHLSPKNMLDNMRAACRGINEPIKELCAQFNRDTKDGHDMTHYSDLLQQAIRSIIEVKEESDILSLFSAGETTALSHEIKGLNDFELICFLVIK